MSKSGTQDQYWEDKLLNSSDVLRESYYIPFQSLFLCQGTEQGQYSLPSQDICHLFCYPTIFLLADPKYSRIPLLWEKHRYDVPKSQLLYSRFNTSGPLRVKSFAIHAVGWHLKKYFWRKHEKSVNFRH